MKRNQFDLISRPLAVAMLFLVALTGCSADGKQQGGEIRIGVIYSNDAVERSETLKAAELAAEKINGSGGVSVKGRPHTVVIVPAEAEARIPERAVDAVVHLINQENVIAIVGPQNSVDAIPAGQIAEEAKIPLIAPLSTNTRTTEGRKFVFRMGFLDDFQGQVMAAFALKDLGIHKMAVLYNKANPYSRGIADIFRKQFEKGGGTVPSFEEYTTEITDFRSQLERIKASGAEALLLPNVSVETREIARQAWDLGLRITLLGTDSWESEDFSVLPEFDGAYKIAHWDQTIPGEEAKEFVRACQGRFGFTPEDNAALTYDAVHLIVEAIRNQNEPAPIAVREGLYAIGPYDGVGGPIDFIDTGDPRKAALILKFGEGQVSFHSFVSPD